MSLLRVERLSVDFNVDGHWSRAVDDVSFSLEKGEILALVGESGCGKSVTCLSLARLVTEPPGRYASGAVRLDFRGERVNVLDLPEKRLREIRGAGVAYIFQEPSTSLNPVFRVGDQIAEAIVYHRPDVADPEAEAVAALRRVGIPDPERRAHAYPHEMSGGMRQRVMIAMALASRPELLVADEPTTALDVTVQAQILELLRRVRRDTGAAMLLVTHNLGIVAETADRVIVMYAGQTVEEAPVEALLTAPSHPYSRALIRAIPVLGEKRKDLYAIPGTVPSPDRFPSGCRFHDRCDARMTLSPPDREKCAHIPPEWRDIAPHRRCRCHFAERLADFN